MVKALIDIAPSVIKTRSLGEVTALILNPRLVSTELLKKVGNMDRILENVTTYFFEHILSPSERYAISYDLQVFQLNKYEIAST